MSSPSKSLTLNDIVKIQLATNGKGYEVQNNRSNELEIRFGTRGRSKITPIDYDNVIKKLKSLGFSPENVLGEEFLKIQNQFVDPKTGNTKLSNLRTTISGLNAIQKYCKENKLTNIPDLQKEFMIKMFAKDSKGTPIYPINKDDFNMRISYQTESIVNEESSIVKSITDVWDDSKKTFRYINRVSFRKDGIPLRFDLSIVKSSNFDKRRQLIPAYNIAESGVFENTPSYEIEIELDNSQVGNYTAYESPESVEKMIKYGIKLILGGLQESNYPISYDEQDMIKLEYCQLFKGKDFKGRIYNKDFIGPSSYTLQIKNIQETSEDSIVPNIRNKFTVTDKADGMRKLLYIANNGKLYLIDTNLKVTYTGCTAKTSADIAGTLIDGEHILHDKNGLFINLYAAFDIYYVKKESIREKSFVPLEADDIKNNYRLPTLIKIISELDLKAHGSTQPMRFEYKRFYMEGESSTIFDGCKEILEKVDEGLFEYETDGLIFTPASMGVGGSKPGESSKPMKITWDYSFKWKPPEYNTIDFLFKTKKGSNGEDEVGNLFQSGTNVTKDSSGILQYKTGELHVGFDTKKHGYINPCSDVIQDNLPSVEEIDNNDTYKPMLFYPTNPYDNKAHLCRIILETDSLGNKTMKTKENQVFEDNTIIEFYYDFNEEDPLKRWIPLRVRNDKTAEFNAGYKNFGNAYHVANSNWHSIHNPITKEMISTGSQIPEEEADDDVYYNRVTKSTSTRALRDFHNLVVKKKLISGIASRGDNLMDFAVGKGGDFSKWISSKLSFVFGVDISEDNLVNKIDGACARYLNYRKQYKSMPYALFVNGNSSLNIKDGSALFSERDKLTTKAVFGETTKDESKLGKGVYRQFGKGAQGFNITSCQFALHYFFENNHTLEQFLINVTECTKLGGYFIGGCYDGSAIFNDLLGKSPGESLMILNNDTKMWEVTKEYNKDTFPPDINSLGYAVNVYQESINKTFKEYLVNFEYLIRAFENFGFIPLPNEEAKAIGLKSGIGSFFEIFKNLEEEVKKKPYLLNDIGESLNMTVDEKRISFYNKYFIFKKIRIVDAKQVGSSLGNSNENQQSLLEKESDELSKKVSGSKEKKDETIHKKTKKRKTKVKLVMKTE